MKYRADIDGLRAVAILLVVLFHAFPGLAPGGFIGVDIFFVISGYLIGGVILYALQAGHFSFATFYKRRILRIFPALGLLLLACFLAGWLLLWPDEFATLGKHIAGGASFISNILLYQETGYFDSGAHAKFLLNLWSLGIEEQFYLIFPLLLWLLFRWPAWTGLCIGALGLCSFLDNILLAGVHPEADFYLPLSRFWELLAGALLQAGQHAALWPQGWAKLGRAAGESAKNANLWAWTGVGALVVALAVCKNDAGQYPGWAALLPVGASMALIAAGPGAWFNKCLLASRGAVFTGKISYALYLWHWPLLAFAYVLMGAPAYADAPGLRLFLMLLAVVLASLTYWLLEQPVRFGALFGRYKILVLVVFMLVMFLAGIWIWRQGGFMDRLPASERERYSQLLIPPMEDAACLAYAQATAGEYAFCRYADAGARQTVALLGDSHAHAAFSGLAALGREMGFNVLLLGRFPERKGSEEEVRAQKQKILRLLETRKDIGPVLIMLRGASYLMKEHNPGDRRKDPLPDREYADMLAELYEFIGRIAAMGKEVRIIEDNPDLNADIRDTIPRELWVGRTHPVYPQTPKAEALARQGQYGAMLAELEKIPGVSIERGTLDVFCPDEYCLLFDQRGLPLYYDDDHLSAAGSGMLAEKVLRPLLERIRHGQ